jgi:alginate O-acetyltransferase complex protein AlgI
MATELAFFSLPLLIVQIYQYVTGDLLAVVKFRTPVRVIIYSMLLLWIAVFGVRASTEFIYFQF